MKIEDVQKLATLSRIDINEDEQKELLKDLESILGYVSEIQEVVTKERNVEMIEYGNVMREDEDAHDSGVYTKDILKEAPSTKDGYIRVKKIL